MRAANIGSGMTMRPRVKRPREVSRIAPARNPRHAPPIRDPIRNVTATKSVVARAEGSRAAKAFTPKILIEAAIVQ